MSNKSISLESLPLRLLTLAVALLIGVAGFFAVRWSIAPEIAQNTPSKEIAEWTTQLAPNDPNTYFAVAFLNEKSFLPAELPIALSNYEKAVSLSPNDYRLWLSLGKLREQSGDVAGAEKALRKSVELAPNYSQTRWTLGNFLLRQKEEDEAFAEIRKAVQANSNLVNPAINLAWQLYEGDLAQISQKIGDSIPIKAGLAPFLVKQKRFDEALAFWNSIPNEERLTTYKANGEGLFNAFIETKNYRNALTIQNQIAPANAEKFNIATIYNGDFEKNVKPTGANLFDWNISEGAQPQISLDSSQKRNGERSLIILFNSATGQEARNVQQTVVVESDKSYKFEVFYRSDLKSNSGVRWEIVDANDGKILSSTSEIGLNSADWTPLTTDFTVPSSTQAIIVRLARVPCKQGICPISGKVWFDDLSLK